MSGQQGYIYQKANRLVDATITANVSPSTRPPLIYPITKRGNGNIRLYGQYNGQNDAQYNIKILDTTLEKAYVSAPVFKGAGTGKISNIVASPGLQAQEIKVLCLSTGSDTTKAKIEIEGLSFQSKQEGSAGNSIYILVDDSTLRFSETNYSTIKPLNVGDTALEGQEWDFDTKPIAGEYIPSDAHRIAFGQDRLHIYRQYKKFEDGRWKYYFILPIQHNVNPGSKVYFVTGGRKVTVTNGIDTEVYSDIITIADFWQKVKESSNLIEPVNSSIDTSTSPSSPAVREFTTKTDAYFLPPYKSYSSSSYAGELDQIWVTNDAKTELIEIKCIDNTYLGSEVWSVKGSSSGDLGEVMTGNIFNAGFVGFSVPKKLPDNMGGEREDWSYKIEYAERNVNETPPPICFSMKLGINARPQSLELKYKKKPPECNCPTVAFSDKCLGLVPEGGEIGMAYTVPDLNYWTDVVFNRMAEKSNEVTPYYGSEYAELSFRKSLAEYQTMFKTLASRIMNLPEDDTTTLQSMVEQYKQLVNSLKIYSYDLIWNPENPPTPATWNGSSWSAPIKTIRDISYDTDLYQSLVDAVLLYERTYGVKKNRIVASGTCYVDIDSDYYWEVSGGKAYLPAFTDTAYYSTVKVGDNYENTKEFAFLISTPCGGTLKEGDTIRVTIGGIQLERTYQVGDVTYLPTIAKQNLYLRGGIDGDDIYTFEVKGDIDSFPNYILDRKNPQPFYHQKLQFRIEDGIIPFAVGDQFTFNIEGGRFIWRKDGGSWSSPLQIQKEIQYLDSGLQIGFDFGVSPSFIQNDEWEALCVQENRASNLTTPWRQTYKGDGNITFSFASPETIDTLVIDNHDLTGTITFQASNVPDFSSLVYNEDIPVQELICKLYITSPITAQYFRLVIGGEHKIGYVFLGSIMRLSVDADKIRPLKRYMMSRQEAKTPFSLINYTRNGYIVEYSSFIFNTDYVMLDEMIEYLKTNNDMPFYFLPNFNYPSYCIRAYIDTDNIEVNSDIDINAPEANRLYSISLPIVGVNA